MSASTRRSWMAAGGMKSFGMYLAVVFLATCLEAIDLECLLHPAGGPSAGENCSCPTPKLFQRAPYNCEVCGEMGPQKTFVLTGFGECGPGIICKAELQSITYGIDSVIIHIINERVTVFGACENAGFEYEREGCPCQFCQPTSPILISLDNGVLSLTGPENGVSFDIAGDGTPDQTAWTEGGGDDAFLILDRNQNGFVDNGQELFGDATDQPITDPAARNGFAALAVFDDSLSGGNEDGFIDTDDAIFSDLQLWIDSNHNGISEAGDLQSLRAAGVEAFDLSYRKNSRTDAHGNDFRYWSKVHTAQGVKLAWDVFFAQQPRGPAGSF